MTLTEILLIPILVSLMFIAYNVCLMYIRKYNYKFLIDGQSFRDQMHRRRQKAKLAILHTVSATSLYILLVVITLSFLPTKTNFVEHKDAFVICSMDYKFVVILVDDRLYTYQDPSDTRLYFLNEPGYAKIRTKQSITELNRAYKLLQIVYNEEEYTCPQ